MNQIEFSFLSFTHQESLTLALKLLKNLELRCSFIEMIFNNYSLHLSK